MRIQKLLVAVVEVFTCILEHKLWIGFDIESSFHIK